MVSYQLEIAIHGLQTNSRLFYIWWMRGLSLSLYLITCHRGIDYKCFLSDLRTGFRQRWKCSRRLHRLVCHETCVWRDYNIGFSNIWLYIYIFPSNFATCQFFTGWTSWNPCGNSFRYLVQMKYNREPSTVGNNRISQCISLTFSVTLTRIDSVLDRDSGR